MSAMTQTQSVSQVSDRKAKFKVTHTHTVSVTQC